MLENSVRNTDGSGCANSTNSKPSVPAGFELVISARGALCGKGPKAFSELCDTNRLAHSMHSYRAIFFIDNADKRLLAALQKNASQTTQELGETVNLSSSQAGRRKQRLESDGVIRGYQAVLNPAEVGLTVQAFVQVEMRVHDSIEVEDFHKLVSGTAEIVSAWTLTGDADYLLRVYCADLSALNNLIHSVLLQHPNVARVKSQIVMDQYKQDTALPL